ncbi:hypothetical protein [Natrialbaceae archaeon AArc-T1-2]|uniref:hypothetical protein n=1 Tax=Natrialbaceae archaeon AArc-T1-2 TaxID=3053904 RepID=UPI00255AC90F|nr:hypothetical protein [Natrialbaceae archaeon AArc-T1-2]WIV68162.1 hypothetical protein QQ977_05395 [Natrialbaceae archaeon AArc-T1-2]
MTGTNSPWIYSPWVFLSVAIGGLLLPFLILYAIWAGDVLSLAILLLLVVVLWMLYNVVERLSRIEATLADDR